MAGDPAKAEHETMAARYRNIIVNGLQAYDDYNLSEEEYQALAWKGLAGTKYYKDGVMQIKEHTVKTITRQSETLPTHAIEK